MRALGLGNIALRAMSIVDLVPEEPGTFDYIVCHGVYSWVPAEVQAAILAACRALLAKEGIAYVSFNTLPGWHMRGMVRDLLLREVGPDGTAAARLDRARAFLGFLGRVPDDGSRAQAMLRSELSLLSQVSDAYLLHEHLATHNRPQYFADFAREAARAGLQYVADAQLSMMDAQRFGPEAEAIMKRMARDVIDTEQFLDYLEVRLFRRALLCRQEAVVDRTMVWSRLLGLRVSSLLQPASATPDLGPDVTEVFHRPGGLELSTSLPLLKAALVILAGEQPCGVPFVDLCARVGAHDEAARASFGGDVLTLFARGAVSLGAGAVAGVSRPGPRPEATALARRQASLRQPSATSLLHRRVALDRLDWALVPRLDGTLAVEELAAGVIGDIAAGKVTLTLDDEPRSDLETVLEVIEQRLRHLGRAGLLLA